MIHRFALAFAVAASACVAMPAGAQEIGIGVGPGGVSVGAGPSRERVVRERAIVRERDDRDSDRTVIIKKDRDNDRGYDRDDRSTTTIIKRD